MNELLEAKLNTLPDSPGVYKMLDASGQIIYVGKAKNLKHRVRQYFRTQSALERKVAVMVSHICDFEYVLTGSETEAFALESNLIKEHKPQYNILLKDDKHFPFIMVNMEKDFPRFEIVRRMTKGSARYFGPYVNSSAMNDALAAIRDYYPVRLCRKDISKAIARRERPCLMYHIGKCCAPCSGNVSREEYMGYVLDAIGFLNGDAGEVTRSLNDAMHRAAAELDFERAAQLRDKLRSVNAMAARQRAIATTDRAADVLAVSRLDERTIVFALFVRGGKVIGTQHYEMSVQEDSTDGDIVASYIKQAYADSADVPGELIVSAEPEERESLEGFLSQLRGKRVRIVHPRRGEKREYVEMALRNAEETLEKQRELLRRQWERGEGALNALAEAIGMEVTPRRIECYDNSHIAGRDTVGAMVVFTDGKPDKGEYRRFRIKAQTNGDDYLAMREVLTRRFERALAGDAKFSRLPELIIVDGGRGQLNVALEVLSELGMYSVHAIGLAEEHEHIILPRSAEPLKLPPSGAARHLVVRIRDEAHRFAISYHRGLRQRSALYSVLDRINGIGDKRKRALFDAFVSLDGIKAADLDALKAVKGMNAASARAVYEYFHQNEEERPE
ncbi:MAG: excinuclease ABC subunit UvrC [Clostridia bacterium]|nr:excinuclease ABC subunit UvrC [Clostridia bacterium]